VFCGLAEAPPPSTSHFEILAVHKELRQIFIVLIRLFINVPFCHIVSSSILGATEGQRGRLLPSLYGLSLILRSVLYVEVTEHIASRGDMNDDMGGVSKEAVMAESRRYLEICHDGLRKNLKIPVRTVCVPA
jgi:hypothetical protein